MHNRNSGGKLFMAGVIGAIAGALGGLLLAPKSGKETREDIAKAAKELADQMKMKASDTQERVKDVFGSASEATREKYEAVRSAVFSRVASLKNAGEDINKEKYSEVVDDVVDSFREDLKSIKGNASKLGIYLKKDWERMKKALMEGEKQTEAEA
jgi:gas vesicle protein